METSQNQKSSFPPSSLSCVTAPENGTGLPPCWPALWPVPQADGGTGQSDRGSTQENEAVRDSNPCRHAQSNRVNVSGLDCRLFERKRVLFRANIGSQAHN